MSNDTDKKREDEDRKRTGSSAPTDPDDTTSSGDAKNDTGEDNHAKKGQD
jgi:hypothetical protein